MQLAADPTPVSATVAAVWAALSTGDWVLLSTMVIGSAGVTGIVTTFIAVARYRSEQRQGRIASTVQVQTVAREEADSAMRIMGETVDRVHTENLRIVSAYNEMLTEFRAMRHDLDECLAKQRGES